MEGVNDLMDELRECPFCGKKVAEFSTAWECELCANFEDDNVCPNYQDWEAEYVSDNGECSIHIVVCAANKGGCGASTGWRSSKKAAMEAWNGRSRS